MAQSNSIWYPTQHSFAGGEVSPRIQVRQDISAYPQSVLAMLNLFPTLQGSTERVPGFSFLSEVSIGNNEDARIIGFRDAGDNPTLAILTGGKLTVQSGFDSGAAHAMGGVVAPFALTGGKQNIIENYDFSLGGRYWNISYRTSGFTPGVQYPTVEFRTAEGRAYAEIQQYWSYNYGQDIELAANPMWFEQTADVPVASDVATLRYEGAYGALGTNAGSYPITQEVIDLTHPRIKYTITDEDNGGAVIFTQIDEIQPLEIGQSITFNRALGFTLPSAGYTGNIKLNAELYFEFTPPPTGLSASAPVYQLQVQWDEITIETEGTPLAPSVDLVTPYQNDELAAIQYVQSPYEPYSVVFVHPDHPPQQLYWDIGGNAFVFEALIELEANWPAEWGVGNFPASCTAYQGRLMLGGHGLTAQTVWGSESGVWDNFTVPTTPTGSDPLELTSTFRSAIKWMAGHKQLIVGTTELEYTIESAQGVLVSGDVDVRVNSSHGGINCQPAAYGDEVMFAAERGSRIRAAARDFSRVGWTCRDMNLLAPHITEQGIVRMVRLRNPHPMLICVIANGNLAVMHYDRDLEFHGWSRISLSGNVVDITVLTNAQGVDVPYAIIQRSIGGVFKLYVEGIPQFVEGNTDSIYMDSNVFQSNLTSSTISGLDHLEGRAVQVVTEHGYVGEWVVIGGEITLTDNNGENLEFTQAAVGLAQPCALVTLPPVVSSSSGGFTAKLRYNEINIRVRNSTAPLVTSDLWVTDFVRSPDRSPSTAMDTVAVLRGVQDVKMANLGWSGFSNVTLYEDTPNRFELLALSYKLASKTL